MNQKIIRQGIIRPTSIANRGGKNFSITNTKTKTRFGPVNGKQGTKACSSRHGLGAFSRKAVEGGRKQNLLSMKELRPITH